MCKSDRKKGEETLKHSLSIQGEELIVYMPKEVDHASSNDLRIAADLVLQNYEIHRIVFDFSETEFMDSSGIGMIMGRYRNIIRKGGRMAAVHVNPRIEKILYLSGIYKLIPIVKE